MTVAGVRELTTESEFGEAFPVLRQLRDRLTEHQYFEYLQEMRGEGYRLFALFDDDEIITVAGVVPRTNFYNGRHLFVADLVTRATRRSEGYGRKMIGFVEAWATDRNFESITLESGLWRKDAHRFYEEVLDMRQYCLTFKKTLGE